MKKILITGLILVCALTVAFGFGTTKKASADVEFLKEVSVTLTDGIDVNYYVSGANDYDTAVMDFSYCNGKTKRITESLTDGSATITFKGIAPQYMTEKVVATLTLKAGETEGATETKEFSLQNYVKSVLALEKKSEQTVPEYAAMRTLAVDLLYYGDEAMRYVATETVDEADLATSVLTDEQKALKTTATAIDKSEYVAPADNTGANFRWVSYGARFDNKFGVYFEFIAKSVENLKIKFSSGTEITEFETRTQTIGESQITVYKAVNELFAVDYANVLTARAYFGETEIGSAITYSVKSLTVDFGSDTKEYALALSACSYGEAAVNYKKTRCLQTQTFVTVNGLGIVKQELEEFDTDKAKTDKDFAAARGVPEDQVFVETPTVDTSGGKSVGAIAKGSQFSTSLKVIENATVNITFVASSTANYKVKDNWKFYIDEVELKLVQNKDIKGGNASQNIWWEWKNTDLGTYNISSGNHVFTAVVENTSCNVDYVAFRVKSYGDYDIGGTELNNQGELGDLYIAENGTYKIEAEDLDKSGWISQQGEGGELTQYWSNDFGDGNCAGFLAQGTVITIKIRTAKSCKLSVVMRVAIPDTSILTDQTVTYYFDEQKLTPSTGGFSFGKRNDADWHYWGDLQLGTIYTEAGLHEVRVTIYGVNIDYFTFETTEMQ